jgi:methionyl-tRNA synthetase
MSNRKRIFIGGAWPYANNSLHVGHIAALLPGDVIARYYRMHGDDVIYVSGTDSHGTPITERSRKENVSPFDIASKYHQEFSKCFEALNFSYDFYSATFMDYHKEHVRKMFLTTYSNGYIYEKEEEQDFCDKCNRFLTDREVVGICPECGAIAKGDQCDECLASFDSNLLLDKKCNICNEPVVHRKNTQLMFRLSSFQNIISEFLYKNKQYWRWNAINETTKYIINRFPDRAITRPLSWGVDVPVKGFEDKKIYVWFEAVMGYLTAGRYVAEKRGIDFDEFMKDDESLESYYIHGKDNIPFHTVIYPAWICSLEQDIQLPKHIISSEYINLNDEKMSKSKGNFKSALELVSTFAADTIRFYILFINPENKDTNFLIDDMIACHNKFLCGGFGNFVNRNLSFILKKFSGIVPSGDIDSKVIKMTESMYDNIGEKISKGELRDTISLMIEYIQFANRYYDENTPWLLVKSDINAFNNVTASCMFIIANMANLFAPVIPEACIKLKDKLNMETLCWNIYFLKEGLILKNVDILFNKLEVF